MRIRRPAIVYFALYAGGGAFLPYATLYYQSRNLDVARIGILLAVGALLGLIASPLWGALSDRVAGSPRVLVVGAAVTVAGLAGLALSDSFPGILAANIVLSIGISGLVPIIDARALEHAGDERAGFGPLRAWGSLGWVVASLGTGLATQAFGLWVLFWVAGSLYVVTAVLGLGLHPIAHARAEQPLRSAARYFRRGGLTLFVFGGFLAGAALFVTIDFQPLRIAELGGDRTMVGLGSAIPAAIEVPTMLAFPWLARRVGGHRLLVVGAVVLGLRSLLSAIGSTPEFLVAGAGIGGIGYALFTIGAITFVSQRLPRALAATGQGIFQGVANGLSSVVAAAAGGAIAAAIGLAGLFGVAVAVALVSVITIALAVRGAARPADLGPAVDGLP